MVGAAYQALDEYELPARHQADAAAADAARAAGDPDYQRWFGSALAKVATAEAALLNCADQHMEICRARRRGRRPTPTATTCGSAASRAR